MTVRTKVWLLVAGSVGLTAAAWVGLHSFFLRRELTGQAMAAGDDVAKQIVEALAALDAEADDTDLEHVIATFMSRHARIQLVELHVEREDMGSSVNIVAPRGDRPEIRRLGPAYRLPEHRLTSMATGDNTHHVELPVDLQGPWKATLLMNWS